jgi:hypothetical protein
VIHSLQGPEPVKLLDTIDGFPVPGSVRGPESARVIVIFDNPLHGASPYQAVRERHVLGEFRLAELAGWRGSRHFIAQLSTEIVLRSHSR